MLLEQLIFAIIAIALFVIIFMKMLKNNDTSYIAILVLSVIGLLIDLVEVLINKRIPFFIIVRYFLAVVIPIAVIIIEKRNLKFLESL